MVAPLGGDAQVAAQVNQIDYIAPFDHQLAHKVALQNGLARIEGPVDLPRTASAIPGQVAQLAGVDLHKGDRFCRQSLTLVHGARSRRGRYPEGKVDRTRNSPQHVAVDLLHRKTQGHAPGRELTRLQLNPLL